jgi:3-polyprenyl-4-hydroxybenzoate decarboxylase
VITGNAQEQDITATVSFGSETEKSATVIVDGSAKTTGTLSIGWILVDYTA